MTFRGITLLASFIGVGVATGCRPSRPAAAAPSPAPASPAAAPAAPARLVAPLPVRYARRVIATGTLKARSASALSMSIPGMLARIAVRRGQVVREGALLAALDDGAALATRQQAEAGVSAAVAQLALADDALQRVSRIGQEGGASESQLFQARAQRDLAAAQLASARAQLEQAKVSLAHHVLRAPFEGVVTRIPDGVGVTVTPGLPLITLVATRPLVLETSLSQAEAAELQPGARAVVLVAASGARSDDATLQVIVPAVDTATNRVPVEISVPNPDGRFLPNAFARAELPAAAPRDAFKVPARALVQREAGYAVWVAGPDGKAHALPVRVLGEESDAAAVQPTEGQWPRDAKVVETPPLGIVEGALVGEGAR